MYKDVLRSIDGIEIFPVISFVIFGLFFVGLGLYVIGFDKKFIKEISNAPLEDGASEEIRKEFSHE